MSFFFNMWFANESYARRIGGFLSNVSIIIAGRGRPRSAFVHLLEVCRHRSSSPDASSIFAVFFEYYHATDIILASHRSSFVAGSRALVGVLADTRHHGGKVVE